MISVRPVIAARPLPRLSSDTESRIDLAINALQQVPPFDPLDLPICVQANVARWSKRLSHELSETLVERSGWPPCAPQHSRHEMQALQSHESQRISMDMASLTRLNILLTGPSGGPRRGDACIAGDPIVSIKLCDAVVAVKETVALLERKRPRPPKLAFAAAVHELVCLNNYHPFRDGNGRTSRALFNLRMREIGLPITAYLPLKELFWVARGGYQIRLRIAEIYGDWTPIVDFFCEIVHIAALWPHAGARESPGLTAMPPLSML